MYKLAEKGLLGRLCETAGNPERPFNGTEERLGMYLVAELHHSIDMISNIVIRGLPA